MNARNRTYHASTVPAPAGSGIRPLYKKVVEDGKTVLRKVGQTDAQALINSYKDECDVNRIVARCAQGDYSALARVQGLYTDITGMPDNPTDAFALADVVNNLTPEKIAALQQTPESDKAETTPEEVTNNEPAE